MGSAQTKQFCVRASLSIELLARLGVRVAHSLAEVRLLAEVMQPESSLRPGDLVTQHGGTRELAVSPRGCTAHETCCLEAAQAHAWLVASTPFWDRELRKPLAALMALNFVLQGSCFRRSACS